MSVCKQTPRKNVQLVNRPSENTAENIIFGETKWQPEIRLRSQARFGAAPHTLTLFKTKIADFPTLFKTEFRFLIPCFF